MKMFRRQLAALAGLALASAAWPAQTLGETDTNSAFPQLKKQQEQLTLENSIAEQQLRKELSKLTAEKQRLELENSVAQQKLQAEVATLQAELDKLNKQTDLLAKRIALKEAERKAKLDDELSASRQLLEKMKNRIDGRKAFEELGVLPASTR